MMELGTYVGPSLVYALRRNLCEPDEKEKITSDECFFYAAITGLMFEHPIFDQPFEQADYSSFLHSQVKMMEIREELIFKLRPTLWPAEVLSFESDSDKLHTAFEKLVLVESADQTKNSDKVKEKDKDKERDNLKAHHKDKNEKIEKKERDKKERDKKEKIKEDPKLENQGAVIDELTTALASRQKKVTITDALQVPLAPPVAPAFAKAKSSPPLTPRKLIDSRKDIVNQPKPD